MANHCIYEKCHACGGEYCARGCGYTCKCGKEETPPRDKEADRRAEQALVDAMPPGWF